MHPPSELQKAARMERPAVSAAVRTRVCSRVYIQASKCGILLFEPDTHRTRTSEGGAATPVRSRVPTLNPLEGKKEAVSVFSIFREETVEAEHGPAKVFSGAWEEATT